ncbi:hypothetical protein [Cohnella sp. WQ 127256]|uniref:hypothetical protein n=1 Tax=Cohnella sp. WQ 127256 TaxID=2938790 RepID=UPI002118F7FF|nr:hypothetical protein [Cohnella sp. WQ 127256]
MEITGDWTDIPKQFNPSEASLEEVLTATLQGLAQMLKDCPNWIMVLVDSYQHTKHNKAMQIIAFNEGFTMSSNLFGSYDPQVLVQGLVKLVQ